MSEDPFEGEEESPTSLHRFLYANGSPVSMVDPTGNMSIGMAMIGVAGAGLLLAMPNLKFSLDHGVIGSNISGWEIDMAVRDQLDRALMTVSDGIDMSLLYPLGAVMLWDHWKRFSTSAEFAKRMKNAPNARHIVGIWGPSSPWARNAQIRLFTTRFRRMDISTYMADGPGRVFQVRYQIGPNAAPGQGFFEFRLDYLSYVNGPGYFEPHYHVRYGGVKIDHQPLF